MLIPTTASPPPGFKGLPGTQHWIAGGDRAGRDVKTIHVNREPIGRCRLPMPMAALSALPTLQ